jgi:hypothetical protein
MLSTQSETEMVPIVPIPHGASSGRSLSFRQQVEAFRGGGGRRRSRPLPPARRPSSPDARPDSPDFDGAPARLSPANSSGDGLGAGWRRVRSLLGGSLLGFAPDDVERGDDGPGSFSGGGGRGGGRGRGGDRHRHSEWGPEGEGHPFLAALEKELEEIERVVELPGGKKNVEVLQCTGQLARQLGGVRITSCKSAKDRTSMSVTLEQAALLQRHHGLPAKQASAFKQQMRRRGVRRANAFKNIGKAKFAFNRFQSMTLPDAYKPPKECAGARVS